VAEAELEPVPVPGPALELGPEPALVPELVPGLVPGPGPEVVEAEAELVIEQEFVALEADSDQVAAELAEQGLSWVSEQGFGAQ
jgi:hypothetical protein